MRQHHGFLTVVLVAAFAWGSSLPEAWPPTNSSSSTNEAGSSGSSACDFWSFTRLVQDPNLRTCKIDSGYELLPPKSSPTNAEMIKLCSTKSCQKLWQNAMTLNFTDCTIGSVHLRADVVDKVAAFCNNPATSVESSYSHENQDTGDTSTSNKTNPEKLSNVTDIPSSYSKNSGNRPSPSVIVGFVLGGILLVLFAFMAGILYWQHNNKQKDHESSSPKEMPSNDNQPSEDFYLMIDESSASGTPRATIQGILADPNVFATRIPMASVRQQVLIGKGSYGEVFRGKYKSQEVAIKKLREEHRRSLNHIEGLLSEVRLMATMEHANIVQFVGVAWDSLADLCVVVEFMDGGDLRSLLVRFEQMGRPQGLDGQKLQIAREIANGLTYLHSMTPKVLHRDLKSRNVLLSETMTAKLTDFGVSRTVALPTDSNSEPVMSAGVGTSLWMAPEVMLGGRYDEKADLFSFGVVLSELDTHDYPYSSHRVVSDSNDHHHRLAEAALLQQIAMGSISVSFSTSTCPEVLAIAQRCLSLDPRERPSASEVSYEFYLALRREGIIDTMIQTNLQ